MDRKVTIKAQDADTITLAGYGVVYGGKDLMGDRFTAETDYWLKQLGYSKVVLYDHGFDDAVKANVVGKGTVTEKDDGLWVEAQMNKHDRYVQQIAKLAEAGVLGWSSGAVAHLVEGAPNDDGVFVYKSWPIAEMSLTVTPAEPRTLGVTELKALIDHAEALKGLLPEGGSSEDPSGQAEGAKAAVKVEMPNVILPREGKTMELDRTALDALKSEIVASLKSEITDTVKGAVGDISSKVETLLKTLENEPAAERAGFITNFGGSSDPATKSFGDFLLAVQRKDVKRLTSVYGSTKDMASNDGTAGGYLVPVDYRSDMLKVAIQTSPLLGLVQEIPVSVSSGSWPALDQFTAPTAGAGNSAFAAGVVATATAEGGTLTETTPVLTDLKWNVNKIGGYTNVDNELIRRSPTAIEALLRMLFGVAVASKREYAILRGTGVGEPLGVLNAPCMVAVTTNADNTFAWVDAMNMVSRFKKVTGNCRFVMHQGVLPDLAAAGFVTGNIARNMEDLGFGAPILSEHMPQDDGDDVILGDWGTYLLWVEQSLSVAFSEHAAFTADKGVWRFTETLDGQPWLKGTITLADPTGSYTVSTFVKHDD